MLKCTFKISLLFLTELSLSVYIGTSIDQESLETPQNEAKYSRYTALELHCFAHGQIPYGDSCYSLLAQGPCNVGEWLILDMVSATLEEPQLVAVCTEKQCNNKDIFWPSDGYCYNVTEGDSSLCPQRGTYLHVDPFGEGICDCRLDKPYVRWFNSEEHLSFECFEAYTRGPCSEGFIVIKKDTQTLCEEDPCIDFQKKGSHFVLWKKDKRCYQLGSRGPCPIENKFIINQESKTPSCISLSNPLHLIDLPTICKTDHAGECVDEIQFSSTSDKFTNQLIQLANEKKKKSTSP